MDDPFLEFLASDGYLPIRILCVVAVVGGLLLRRKRPAQFDPLPPLIGNMSNNIYHSNQCQYGRRVGKANRQALLNHAEALHYGYRPCKECLGPYAIDPEVEVIASDHSRNLSEAITVHPTNRVGVISKLSAPTK